MSATRQVTNGTKPSRPLLPGINAPLVAFFHPDTEDIDLETTKYHAIRIANAGMASITVQGSNGEACHLSHQERNLITSTIRQTLDNEGFYHLPLIVGCGAQSVRETVKLCCDAYASGGDYALVLPPSYFRTSYTEKVLTDYFLHVAEKSPIPVLVYNYPMVVSGLDLNSNIITALAKHPNIVGCKLTCGNTGKLDRIANAVNAANVTSQNSGWMCMGGSADFTLQTLIVGGSGVITGLANIAPKACVKIYDLYKAGNIQEAQRVQAIVSRGDLAVAEGGALGLKLGLDSFFGYGGVARRPLPSPSSEETERFTEMYREVVELERGL